VTGLPLDNHIPHPATHERESRAPPLQCPEVTVLLFLCLNQQAERSVLRYACSDPERTSSRRSDPVAAFVPVLVMVVILAVVFYLAKRSAYKDK
jgi:hypothetical protein